MTEPLESGPAQRAQQLELPGHGVTARDVVAPARTRLARLRSALALALLASVSLSACGGADEDEQTTGTPEASTPSPSRSATSPPAGRETAAPGGTPIRIVSGDTELTGRLLDNATARDLAGQLPLTLTFRDHNSVEKTAPLPRELSLDGAPEGHDPVAGDIGYWAPGGDLVLYYDSDAPSFNGIVRIGRFEGDLGAIARLRDGFTATTELAE
jgi:hypothetical protein